MSFYPQPDLYRCGPFALKYALVMLGVFKHEDQIANIAGSSWWDGTDEFGLARAAKKFNCRMKPFQSSNSKDALRFLNERLKKRIPCILSVKNWEHWMTVINYSKGKYLYVDSENDKVIGIKSASQLLRYWRYRSEEDNITSYDGYGLQPVFRIYTKANFTVQMAKELMYKKNDELAKKWDQYFTDLISITKPRTKLTTNMITFSEFLRRNEINLVEKVADWHGMAKYNEVSKVLYNMNFVAEIYDLIIPLEDEKKVIIDITALLSMYVCGKYGMDKFY